MGLFSSSSKTYVGTTIARVLRDTSIVPSTKTGVMKAIMQGGSISDQVLEDLVSGMGTKGKRFFNHGRDRYLYGLPSGQVNTPTQGSSEVQAILNALEGVVVTLAYNFYGGINYSHLGWKALHQAYTVSAYTNELFELSQQKNTTVLLVRLTLILQQATFDALPPATLVMWGGNCIVQINPSAPAEAVGVSLTYFWFERVYYTTGGGNDGNQPYSQMERKEQTDLLTSSLSVAGYAPGKEYFQVKYAFDGITRFWDYEIGLGTYPTLDKLFNVPLQIAGTYFPFGYFRYNKISMAALSEAEGYASSKRLMKKLGLDYDMLLDAIHKNPDIADVEQAMLFMAVPAGSINRVEQEYLYRYFDQMFFAVGGQVTSLSIADMATDFPASLRKENATVVQDARFKLGLSNLGILRRRVTGSIGAVGHYASSTAMTGYPVTYNTGGEAGSDITYTERVFNHLYRKQVSATVYDEIQVMNLTATYYIFGVYNTLGTGAEHADRLLIPLDLSVMGDLSLPEKEALYSRAMHYVFNSNVQVKVAWYQSEFFSFVLIVVAVALAVQSAGASLASLSGSAAAGTLTVEAVLLAIATGTFNFLVTQAIVQLFVKLVGVELAFLAALVAAAYGVRVAMQAGSLAGAPFAQELLSLANNLAKGVSQSISQAMAGLQDEAKEFTSWMGEQNKLLETANELLQNQSVLSPFTIFGETPDEFFNRTVHSGNIGLNAIEAISEYVKLSLTLPKLHETLQGDTNGLL